MNIILVGFKAVGKSTIGRRAAKNIGMTFIDVDHQIERLHFEKKNERKNCRDIYSVYGEKYFRNIEEETIEKIDPEDAVIAAGGGAVESKKNRERLKSMGKVVYLSLDKEILFSRIERQGWPPFFKDNPRESFEELFCKRDPIYRKLSDHICICDNLNDHEIINEIKGMIV